MKKALYGLKQSPRDWFERFRAVMVKVGYRQCQADHSLFVKHQGTIVTRLIMYVVDVVVTRTDDGEITGL